MRKLPDLTCDRCKCIIKDAHMVAGAFTAGFYFTLNKTTCNDWGWLAEAKEDEDIICDDCMFKSPRYIEVYGRRD